MTRDKMIKDMLKFWTKDNTVCMNKRMSKLLKFQESKGMLPPFDNRGMRVEDEAINYCKWKKGDK